MKNVGLIRLFESCPNQILKFYKQTSLTFFMKKESYNKFLKTAGTIFLIVGFLHLYRAFSAWTLVIENFTIPVWFSFVAGILIIFLSFWAFKLSKK